MYIVNTEITVNWLVLADISPPVFGDFDVTVKKPDGTSEYFESVIPEDDYIIPTENTNGAVSYAITPDQQGVWLVVLSTGVDSAHDIEYEYYLTVYINDTHVYQQVPA